MIKFLRKICSTTPSNGKVRTLDQKASKEELIMAEIVTEFNQLNNQTSFFGASSQESYPHLFVLDQIVNQAKDSEAFNNIRFDRIAIVGMQHLLETTSTLVLDGLVALGVKTEHIFLAGKCYSASPNVERFLRKQGVHVITMDKPEQPGEYWRSCKRAVNTLWTTFCEHINLTDIDSVIILDDGARTAEYIPKNLQLKLKIAVIEQTRGGLYRPTLKQKMTPLIDVASSAAKKILEPPLIAEAIHAKIDQAIHRFKLEKNYVCAIVGLGSIGKAVTEHLLSLGYHVIIYDTDHRISTQKLLEHDKCHQVDSIQKAIINANCIFGCTGKDITHGIDIFNIIEGEKIFISCSSEDKEFLTLLGVAKSQLDINTLSDLVFHTGEYKDKVIIASGGFPINFDGSKSSVPAEDISLTRGLLLCAFLQAASIVNEPSNSKTNIMHQALDPLLQSFVASTWLEKQGNNRHHQTTIDNFKNNYEWIIENSGGESVVNVALYHSFYQKNSNSIKSAL